MSGFYLKKMISGLDTEANVDSSVKSNQKKEENVIMLVGDGMGPSQVSAAAYLKGKGYVAGELTMDQFSNLGYARTFSHDNTVTDSAAAVTAFSSANKTDNGVVGKAPKTVEHSENEDHFNVESVLESAEKADKSTGLVSTARITHATPAAFASHVENRDNENEIAKQMLLDHDIEVLLGGGKRHFLPKEDGGKREDGKT
ncbi:alkaline phosphatase [Halobacillus shinanisalinarum]|uniref:Alkaline phosphatase n=1 Tax=Halobacillus shinanisalinarum TaxID=2932258 RepID=A0ABY4H458_9BACI|nr:alkaline phosphatase [Halobacillus shinanisalinarum]UOQ95104.1 alkaline phosphatase [Halobacillus shinanisalinarum]